MGSAPAVPGSARRASLRRRRCIRQCGAELSQRARLFQPGCRTVQVHPIYGTLQSGSAPGGIWRHKYAAVLLYHVGNRRGHSGGHNAGQHQLRPYHERHRRPATSTRRKVQLLIRVATRQDRCWPTGSSHGCARQSTIYRQIGICLQIKINSVCTAPQRGAFMASSCFTS